MSRKKVLLASSLTLCSASTSFAAGSEKQPMAIAEDIVSSAQLSERPLVTMDTSNRYLAPISAVAVGNVVVKTNEENQSLTYQVKKGDNLFRIGLFYGLHFQEIAAYNQIKTPNKIYVGQNLKIPFIPKWVRVQRETTLQSLAKKHQTTVQLIKALNPSIQKIEQSLTDQWIMVVQKLEIVKTRPVEKLKPSSTKKKRVVRLAKSFHKPVLDEAGQSFIWPVHGRVTSNFGWRNGRPHKGIDIWHQARSKAEIIAAKDGVVTRAGYANGYGNLVVIDHGDGWETYYAHLSWISVSKGQKVSKGTFLGNMGKTGNATGYHLHFEIRQHNKAINPLGFLN